MIIVNDLKPGTTFIYEGNLYMNISTTLNKTAMRQMVVKSHAKDLRTGINKDRLQWELNFLKPQQNIMLTVFEGEILGVDLPDKVALEVTVSEKAVKGDTATSALKNATVETGWVIKVPLFIEEGEIVMVSTIDGKYCGRA